MTTHFEKTTRTWIPDIDVSLLRVLLKDKKN